MNGRVYDPAIGRFLSVDPIFQFPTNTQSINPYTYVLNSPLSHTDPTGFCTDEDTSECDTNSGGNKAKPRPEEAQQNDNGRANRSHQKNLSRGGHTVALGNGGSVTVNGSGFDMTGAKSGSAEGGNGADGDQGTTADQSGEQPETIGAPATVSAVAAPGAAQNQAPATTSEAPSTEQTNSRVTDQNIEDLATILMSEASTGTPEEQQAVGSTVINRMNRNKTDSVQDVRQAYATNQAPTDTMRELAKQLLSGELGDNTGGATHYYSPRSMSNALQKPRKKEDIEGGLEHTPGLRVKNFRPGWATKYDPREVSGVRPAYFKFYAQPGTGKVY